MATGTPSRYKGVILAREDGGFEDLLEALAEESSSFERPVLLLHGDTHVYRLDKPLVNPPGDAPVVRNLTRVETFGSPDVGWVRVTVEPRDPELFTVTPEQVDVSL